AGILAALAKIFSYDVDFQRDIQPGDSFEVVFERMIDEDGQIARTGEMNYAALTLGGTSHRIFRFKTADGTVDYFNEKGESVRKALPRTPIDGARLTSRFGRRVHPLLGYTVAHKGVDYAAATGTPIMAAGNGVVVEADWKGAYG